MQQSERPQVGRKNPFRPSQLPYLFLGLVIGALPLIIVLALTSLGGSLYCTNQVLGALIGHIAVPILAIIAIIGALVCAIFACIKKGFYLAIGIAITYVPTAFFTIGFIGLAMGWIMSVSNYGVTCHL